MKQGLTLRKRNRRSPDKHAPGLSNPGSFKRSTGAFLLILLTAVCSVLLVACEDIPHDGKDKDAAFNSSMDAAAELQSEMQVSATIGQEGGTLRITKGPAVGAEIVIPPGALAAPVTISMRVTNDPRRLPDLPKDRITGPVLRMEPDGQTFAVPVTLTLPVTSVSKHVFFMPESGNNWEPMSASYYDASKNAMVVQTTHFCYFAAGTDEQTAGGSKDYNYQLDSNGRIGYLRHKDQGKWKCVHCFVPMISKPEAGRDGGGDNVGSLTGITDTYCIPRDKVRDYQVVFGPTCTDDIGDGGAVPQPAMPRMIYTGVFNVKRVVPLENQHVSVVTIEAADGSNAKPPNSYILEDNHNWDKGELSIHGGPDCMVSPVDLASASPLTSRGNLVTFKNSACTCPWHGAALSHRNGNSTNEGGHYAPLQLLGIFASTEEFGCHDRKTEGGIDFYNISEFKPAIYSAMMSSE